MQVQDSAFNVAGLAGVDWTNVTTGLSSTFTQITGTEYMRQGSSGALTYVISGYSSSQFTTGTLKYSMQVKDTTFNVVGLAGVDWTNVTTGLSSTFTQITGTASISTRSPYTLPYLTSGYSSSQFTTGNLK